MSAECNCKECQQRCNSLAPYRRTVSGKFRNILTARKESAESAQRSLVSNPVLRPQVRPANWQRNIIGANGPVPAAANSGCCNSLIWPCDSSKPQTNTSYAQSTADNGAKAGSSAYQASTLMAKGSAYASPTQDSQAIDPAQALLDRKQAMTPLPTQAQVKTAGTSKFGLILLGLVGAGYYLYSKSAPKPGLNGPAKSKSIQINF